MGPARLGPVAALVIRGASSVVRGIIVGSSYEENEKSLMISNAVGTGLPAAGALGSGGKRIDPPPASPPRGRPLKKGSIFCIVLPSTAQKLLGCLLTCIDSPFLQQHTLLQCT